MDIVKVILLCVATFVAANDPKVREYHEEGKEIARSAQHFKSPVFNYKLASQQDNLKSRYAQQQQFDAVNLRKIRRSPAGYSTPRPIVTYEKYNNQKEERDAANNWQQFQPRILRQIEGGKVRVNLGNDETASDREDIYGQVVYVHPSLLRESFDAKSRQKPIVYSVKQNQNELNALTDLLGKNPNVQLEGLKRLLQQSPVISNPQPFKHNIIEDTPKPSIQVAYEKSPVPLPTAPINKESLTSLQQQLDQASQLQADKVLARAQEEARAHVEAQHKAIAEAQKAILEKVQSMYHTPQALPLTQPKIPLPVYPKPPSNAESVIRVNPNLLQISTPSPNAIVIQEKPNVRETFISEVPVTQFKKGESFASKEPVPHFKQSELLISQPIIVSSTITPEFLPTVITTPQPPIRSSQNPLKSALLSKNVNFYAPNHIHEAVVQYQAEKAIRAQVKSNNKAILDSKRSPNGNRGTKVALKKVQKPHEYENESGDQSSATTYQQVVFNSDPIENHPYNEEDQYEDGQYAANYAFGYQIRDAEEGNDYGHQEKRSGKSLEGSYHVLLPDGRRQKVEYYADDTGYHAKVTYENLAQHK